METGYYFYRTKPHNMKPEIIKQYNLMVKAIYLLEQMGESEQIESKYGEVRTSALQKLYAETMSELAGELVKLAKPITNNQTQD